MYDFELFRHGHVPPAVQQSVIGDVPALRANPGLDVSVLASLNTAKIPSRDAEMMLARRLPADLLFRFTREEKRGSVLSTMLSANAAWCEPTVVTELFGLLAAKRTLPLKAVRVLAENGTPPASDLPALLERTTGMVKLQLLVSMPPGADEELLAAHFDDTSWLPNSELSVRHIALTNLASFHPDLHAVFARSEHPAPATALAGVMVGDDAAATLAGRDEKLSAYTLMALLYNPFVRSELFAQRQFANPELQAGVLFRSRQTAWPVPSDLSSLDDVQYAALRRRALGMRDRPTLLWALSRAADALVTRGVMPVSDRDEVAARIARCAWYLPWFARPDVVDDEAEAGPVERDDRWQSRAASGCYLWHHGNSTLASFSDALGDSERAWRTAAELLPTFGGTLGDLVEVCRSL